VLDPFELEFVQRGVFEVLLLSAGAGLLGTWIVLRGLAFYSHAVGSATFPGLVLADGLGFAAPLGAFAAALVYALGVGQASRARRTSYDTVTAVVLVGALALGVILASDVFHSGSNIETLLFGSLLAIDGRDLVIAAVASVLAIAATTALGRAWLAAGFDPDAARSLGLRSPLPDAILLALIAAVVTAAISAVGALLATSLIVIPAATVRLWTRRLAVWQAVTVVLVAIEGVFGLWLSVKLNAPPGATIAVVAGGAFLASALARAAGTRRLAVTTAALATAVAIASCGSGDSDGGGGKLVVAATTTQVADWVRQVGGAEVEVHQILKPNSDPHDYEPRPADVEAVAGASVVFRNGDKLDDWMSELVSDAGGDPETVDLSRAVTSVGGDPHWWHDPRNAVAAVGAIASALSRADAEHARDYERNASRYVSELRRLDRAIATCMSQVPRAQRKLVTDHDALSYFARRYGIEVVGAVIPSQTTQAQPSARDVSRLVKLIEREHVRAVFPGHSVSPKLARSIARETGASAHYVLYGDTLGPAGSDGDTYLKMEAANARSMVSGFSGGSRRCPAESA
jgi:ABC-type Zn uptake system ZnuABC Zn-binding protein ZnuA/ABC-type Mn2+/Zn2+ transport system permease subunit